jgi:hypothetical protein
MEKLTESTPTNLQPLIPENPGQESAVNPLFMRGKRFLSTETGYVGLAPDDAARGNEMWVLHGCAILVLLRKCPDGETWLFVGKC